MRTWLTVAFIVWSAALSGAQEKLADQLRKGIVQEEANQDADKAIAAYKSIVAQYDQDRQTAATALYRLAECYRKTGKRELAVAAYQRVIREFADQAALVEPSRQQLASAYGITETRPGRPAARPAASPEFIVSAESRRALQREVTRAQLAVRAAERDVQAVEDKVRDYQQQIKNGNGSADSTEFRQLRRDLEAARDRMELARTDLMVAQSGVEAAGAKPPEVTPESLKSMQIEIDVLQKELDRSKALVEVGQLSPLDYQKAQARFEQAVLRYQSAVKNREAGEAAVRDNQALNQRLARSLEDEIALLKNWIGAAEKGVVKGYSTESPELLQLKRELLALQRRLDQVRSTK